MKRLNQKGFTLVELLGVFAILSIIMLVAIPNVMGILDKNKKNTYIQHAKQMIALAEYKLNSDSTIRKPTTGNVIVFSLSCLGNSDIETGPEGGDYIRDQSFVAITRSGNRYQYYVTLRETTKNDPQGLELISQDELNKTTASNHIMNLTTQYGTDVGSTLSGLGIVQYKC